MRGKQIKHLEQIAELANQGRAIHIDGRGRTPAAFMQCQQLRYVYNLLKVGALYEYKSPMKSDNTPAAKAPEVVARAFERGPEFREHGRSHFTALCPFCGEVSRVYVWCFNGRGKRCGCGSLFTPQGCLPPAGKNLKKQTEPKPKRPGVFVGEYFRK